VPTPDLPETSSAVPRELVQPKLLIGEGRDEVNIFGALLNHLAISDVKVEDYGGKEKLPEYLDALKLRPGYAELISLGVTRDADASSANALTSVRNHLNTRGFATPDASGNFEAGSPNVGIMIFPNGQHAGMLEDLCLEAWREDTLIPCIDDYFNCVSAVKGANPGQISKARVHAWLAAQTPPDLRLGIAAQKGLIDWTNPAFERLREFVTML